MTTDLDLRRAFDSALDGLPPMPDVSAAVVAEGGRAVVRRRVGSAVGVAASVAALVAASSLVPSGTIDADAPSLASADGRTGITHVQQADDDQGSITRADWNQEAAQLFSELFPVRFSDVQVTPRGWVTTAGDTTVKFNMTVYKIPDFEDASDCAANDNADSCRSVELAPTGRAIALHEQDDIGWEEAGLEMYLMQYTPHVELAMNFFSTPTSHAVPLSDQEILDVATSPEFNTLYHEFIDHPQWLNDMSYILLQENGDQVQGTVPGIPHE